MDAHRRSPAAGVPYWIHVEMVYGIPSMAIHKQLTLEQALPAFAALTLLLFGLVRMKEWLLAEAWVVGPRAPLRNQCL